MSVSGVTLISNTGENVDDLAIWGSKDGKIYLAKQNDPGGLSDDDRGVLQSFYVTPRTRHEASTRKVKINEERNIHGSPVFWESDQGRFIHVMGESDFLKMFRLVGNQFLTDSNGKVPPFSQSRERAPYEELEAMPGGFISLSANGNLSDSSVVWLSYSPDGNPNAGRAHGILAAYNATDLSQNSGTAGPILLTRLEIWLNSVLPQLQTGRSTRLLFQTKSSFTGLDLKFSSKTYCIEDNHPPQF